MPKLNVTTNATDRFWDPAVREWRDCLSNLSGEIPAPIDAECVTEPEQLRAGDGIAVHAMGTWYNGTVIAARPKSGKLEVEYKSGSGTVRRKNVHPAHLVPAGCGYGRKSSDWLAAQWAAAVWAVLKEAAIKPATAPAAVEA